MICADVHNGAVAVVEGVVEADGDDADGVLAVGVDVTVGGVEVVTVGVRLGELAAGVDDPPNDEISHQINPMTTRTTTSNRMRRRQ